jgi:ABC-type antimicrobial peptide transport system permease subunit
MNLWKILTFIGAAIGALFVFGALASGSAPQQAAAAGIALFFVVAPYCVQGVIYRAKRDRNPS